MYAAIALAPLVPSARFETPAALLASRVQQCGNSLGVGECDSLPFASMSSAAFCAAPLASASSSTGASWTSARIALTVVSVAVRDAFDSRPAEHDPTLPVQVTGTLSASAMREV